MKITADKRNARAPDARETIRSTSLFSIKEEKSSRSFKTVSKIRGIEAIADLKIRFTSFFTFFELSSMKRKMNAEVRRRI